MSGTARTVTALALDCPHTTRITFSFGPSRWPMCSGSNDQLAPMPATEGAALGPMHPGRIDVIVGGALILREVVRAAGNGGMVASEHDILDGIALSLRE